VAEAQRRQEQVAYEMEQLRLSKLSEKSKRMQEEQQSQRQWAAAMDNQVGICLFVFWLIGAWWMNRLSNRRTVNAISFCRLSVKAPWRLLGQKPQVWW